MSWLLVSVFAVVGLVVGARAVRTTFRRVIVHEYEAALLYRRGAFLRRVGPGAYLASFRGREVVVVDLRRRIATVAGQEVLTQEGVGLKVSLAASWEVADPLLALHRTASHEEALHVAVQLALRATIGGMRIEDLLAQRGEIGGRLLEVVGPQAEAIGLRVHALSVKDVMLPGDLKRIFAEVVRAQKEGQAAMERARAETAALRSLANAARVLQDHPALLSLRTLQALSDAAGRGASVVVGVPPGLAPVGVGVKAGRDR